MLTVCASKEVNLVIREIMIPDLLTLSGLSELIKASLPSTPVFVLKSYPKKTRAGEEQPPKCVWVAVWVAVGWLIPNSHPGWLLGG